jgi:hypothetical protein
MSVNYPETPFSGYLSIASERRACLRLSGRCPEYECFGGNTNRTCCRNKQQSNTAIEERLGSGAHSLCFAVCGWVVVVEETQTKKKYTDKSESTRPKGEQTTKDACLHAHRASRSNVDRRAKQQRNGIASQSIVFDISTRRSRICFWRKVLQGNAERMG